MLQFGELASKAKVLFCTKWVWMNQKRKETGKERERGKKKKKIGNNTKHVLTKMMLRLDCYVIFVFRRVGDW